MLCGRLFHEKLLLSTSMKLIQFAYCNNCLSRGSAIFVTHTKRTIYSFWNENTNEKNIFHTTEWDLIFVFNIICISCGHWINGSFAHCLLFLIYWPVIFSLSYSSQQLKMQLCLIFFFTLLRVHYVIVICNGILY